MSIIRVVVDVEADGDTTNKTAEEIAAKLQTYADSVVGPTYLAEKQGDVTQRWHVHNGGRGQCQDCENASNDGKS